MSIPGSGLLAALRRKTQGGAETLAPDETKFAARSSAVHALEQAVATGAGPEGARKAAQGCPINASNGTFVYNLDDSHPGEEYPELTFAPVTRVPAEYKESNVRQIAVSEEFITYGLKQGHIRVLHRFSEARALLKGHTQPIADICFVGDDVVIAGGHDGELFGWKLSVHDGDNAIHAEQFLHAKFSPGCDTSPVTLATLSARYEVAVAVGNAVMVLKPNADVATDLEIDPLDPTPARKMPNFPVQDAPTAISGSEDGTYLAAGSKHGRVYVAKIESGDGSIKPRAHLDVGAGSPISAVAWLNSTTLLVSTASGTKQMLFSTTDDAVSFVPGNSVVLETSASANKEKPFVHTQVVSAQNLVIMADTPRKQVYTLHWSAAPAGHAVRFDYLARFKVGLPILNFTAMWNPDQGEEGAVEIDCVQTEAVQQYFLDPKLCSVEDGSGGAASGGGDSSTVTQIQESESASTGVIGPSASDILGAANGGATSHQLKEEEIQAAEEEEEEEASTEKEEETETETEGCPTPPASLADSTANVVEIPAPVIIPSVSEPSPSAPAAVPTKLLTPSDILRSTPKDLTPRSEPPAPTMKVLQRNTPSPAPAIVSPEPEEIAASTAATTTAAGASAGAAGQADVAAAVAEEMSTVHRKFAGHVSAMYKELLKAMRSEMTAQAAANEKLMREALAAQAAAVAAERAAVLAEERANMERLLGAISTTLNRDVFARLSEAMRTELDGVAATIAASMAPAVKEAVSAALPKETSAAVKSALDKHLASSLQTGLSKPIQDSFRQAFTKQIVPSFENACQSMFLQMDKTLTKGFSEHTEAAKSALSEPVALAASLRESLAEAARLGGGFSGDTSVGGLARAPSVASSMRSPRTVDVKTELRGMITQGRYEEAFSKALGLQDVSTVGWLCTQADAATVLSTSPPALSQMVLLSLVQQLAADIATSPSNKLQWIREAALALNPQDPLLGPHLRPVLEQVHAALAAAVGKMQGGEVQSCKLAMHVIHSQMSS